MTSSHARPDTADMRAGLATARAILDGADPGAAHQAAETGACPACVAVAGINLMISIVATLAGDQGFVSERSRRAMLAAVEAAERDLDSGPN
jgi:hypothetical protein